MGKERIDIVLTEQGLAPSREKAKTLILAGEVFIGTERVTKPDLRVETGAEIYLKGNPIPFVSYGGVKLEAALTGLNIDVTGMIVLDIGSSTGGFTDCLLKKGAVKVYAIDTGTHQLHEKLRSDERVILRENTNARYLLPGDIGESFSLVVIDVSFISLTKILPVAASLLSPGGRIISLVKPQFEVGRYEVGKGGIVKDVSKIDRVIDDMKAFGRSIGLMPAGVVEAPREKQRKNREFFILWEK